MVVTHLVSAASQSDIQGLSFDKSINHDCFSNLAKSLQLIGYFKDDLDRAITSNELHTFQDVPPIYTTLMEASTTKNDHRIGIGKVTVTATETAIVTRTETETHVKTQRRVGAVTPPATPPATITTTQTNAGYFLLPR